MYLLTGCQRSLCSGNRIKVKGQLGRIGKRSGHHGSSVPGEGGVYLAVLLLSVSHTESFLYNAKIAFHRFKKYV